MTRRYVYCTVPPDQYDIVISIFAGKPEVENANEKITFN